MDKACIYGLMVEHTMENGKMESNMEMVITLYLIVTVQISSRLRKVPGLMESGRNGKMISQIKS